MGRIEIAHIVLDGGRRMLEQPALFCRATGPFEDAGAGTVLLKGPGVYDFTTFFNALSVMKWRRYTSARSFSLHLEVTGAACTVGQTRADTFSRVPEAVGARIEIPASKEWRSVDLPLAEAEGDVLIAFCIEAQGEVRVRNARYCAEADQSQLNGVELALVTTTFQRESYVLGNMDLVRRALLESEGEIAHHLQMHVIDNGRTLGARACPHPFIHVHPNPNAGGAGGFARGMLEALSQSPRATHVLLMDDDVEVSPESIFRTYMLLRLARREWREAFVSGAMLNLDEPDVRWEDVGFMSEEGLCRQVKPVMRMSVLHDAVINEAFVPPERRDGCAGENQRYAAWWYCCIPVRVIEHEGLPLPLFVRYDDVEFGLRCSPRFMTMNGICIWHAPFQGRYSAAVERYQTTRNAFVAQAASGVAPESDFLLTLRNAMQVELKNFNYRSAELVLAGFEDFLDGPQRMMNLPPDQLYLWACKRQERLAPFDELNAEALRLGVDLNALTTEDATSDAPRSRLAALFDFLTFNGQRGGGWYTKSGKVAVVDAGGGSYQAGKLRRAETVVAVDVYRRRATIRRRDVQRFRGIWRRYRRDVLRYRLQRRKLERAWALAGKEMMTERFWRSYLGMEDVSTGDAVVPVRRLEQAGRHDVEMGCRRRKGATAAA